MTTPNTTTDAVSVTDADREIAEVLCKERCAQAGDPPCSRVCGDGQCDECIGMAMAVRQSTTTAQRELQEARELLRDVAQEVRDLDGAGTLPSDLMARIDRLTQASDGGEG